MYGVVNRVTKQIRSGGRRNDSYLHLRHSELLQCYCIGPVCGLAGSHQSSSIDGNLHNHVRHDQRVRCSSPAA